MTQIAWMAMNQMLGRLEQCRIEQNKTDCPIRIKETKKGQKEGREGGKGRRERGRKEGTNTDPQPNI